LGLLRVIDVDHLEPAMTILDIGVGAGDGHILGVVRRVHAAHKPRTPGIHDIDHQEAGIAVCNIVLQRYKRLQ
jgi:hypothetical protein